MLNAKKTLESSSSDINAEFFNWSCFKSQQAAEYALKAYLRGIGVDSYGRSVSGLISKIGLSDDFIRYGKLLDKYYIPTRYTDAWAEGIPSDYYTIEEAKEAFECSEAIIMEMEAKWKSLREGK